MINDHSYLIRSQADGKYLVARPQVEQNQEQTGYLLIFRERFEALSYLNTHAQEVANRFAVESVSGTQLKNLLQRWGFKGIGLVKDPLLPKIEFLTHN